MKLILLSIALLTCACAEPDPELMTGLTDPLVAMKVVNDQFIASNEPGDNKWARAVYFTGNMAAFETLGEPAYADYALAWAEDHDWELHGVGGTRDADKQAAGQTYLALYDLDPDPERIADLVEKVDEMIDDGDLDDWHWVDAFYMAAPIFARLGVLRDDPRYLDALHLLYLDAKVGRGLHDAESGLWYRDESYVFPEHTTPNRRKIFWSRGNGWVIAAMARTVDALPADSRYRDEYIEMVQTMAAAVARLQRADGFWNVSLDDAEDHPGPESSGTALFAYAIAWGIDRGHLDRTTYLPVVERAWTALVEESIHADGTLGYVQGVGEEPSSAQPVTFGSTADFGVGVFLLAASEVQRLGVGAQSSPGYFTRASRGADVGLTRGAGIVGT